MTNRVFDLSAATDAFVADAMDNLGRTEKSGGEYSSLRSFLWQHGKPIGLSVLAIARPTQYVGEFELNLTFPGPEGSKFRTTHQIQLIGEMSAALKIGGWEIIPVAVPGKAGKDEASSSSDGIFFTVKRPEMSSAPVE